MKGNASLPALLVVKDASITDTPSEYNFVISSEVDTVRSWSVWYSTAEALAYLHSTGNVRLATKSKLLSG